jgi:outer membrane protein assembly factor BamB
MRRTSMAVAAAAVALGALALPTVASADTASAHAASAPAAAGPFGSSACPDVAQHEDAAHDGYNCSYVSPHASKLWSDTLPGQISYPVIAGGRVFVTTSTPGGSYGGDLYALNAQTGKIEWGPVALSGTYFYFPLAYDNGQVFVNDFDGTVRAFNAATGALDWSTATLYFSSEPVVSDGTVWVFGAGVLYGLSEQTGAVTAQSSYLNGDGATPAVNASGVYLSTATGCDAQYRLSLSAAVVWNYNGVPGCSGGGGSTAALWGGKLMYGSDGHEVLSQSAGTLEGTFSGVPAFGRSTGYFASGDTVSALDIARGNAPVWTATLSSTVAAGPVVTPNAVWVGTSGATLVALSPATGKVLNTIQLPGAPGGGGQYSGTPSDIGVGGNTLVVPSGSTITAFGNPAFNL